MRTQFGISQEADLESNTWTFRMTDPFSVCAGEFAIVPLSEYPEFQVYPSLIKKEMAEAIKQRESDPENYRFWDGKVCAYEQLLAKLETVN